MFSHLIFKKMRDEKSDKKNRKVKFTKMIVVYFGMIQLFLKNRIFQFWNTKLF